ncbi:MAG: DUF255 domain-containing protein [Granulosicoccus sp.]|nr:DUF255 domain-containing protein [Granulosicoccus sp.]
MKLLPACITGMLLLSSAVFAQSDSAVTLENQLKDHPAPYLALHGDDPVAWQEWGTNAVERARQENKILFVSVGYFACHWCHVMQQESYQDDEVADFLNDQFISIKVDRELEPALDGRLMSFTQAILGRGGWPLNVFITPEGDPIYALLYAPRGQFMQVLERLNLFWEKDPDKVRELVQRERQRPVGFPSADWNVEELETLVARAPGKMLVRADLERGGFGDSSKFPSAPQMHFLLSEYERTGEKSVKEFIEVTLDGMATQGMHDHLTGGFFRYTVDADWYIPHFEKMLYDNAALADLYLQAGRVFSRDDYLDVAKSTLQFMQQAMWLDGALVASFSAVDDDSVEGGHYLWQMDELKTLLTADELNLVSNVWGLDRAPELEAGTLPRWDETLADYATTHNASVKNVSSLLASAREKLITARSKRSLPVDDKLLAGWNGLALNTFANAYAQFGDDSLKQTAENLATFLTTQLWDGKELVRARAKGVVQGTASIEDYAHVANGLWTWGEITENAELSRIAEKIARIGWQKFYKNAAWFTEDGSLLAPPTGVAIMEDGAIASPAAVLIAVSDKIARAVEDQDWILTVKAEVNRGQRELASSPYWFSTQMLALRQVMDSEKPE